MFLLTYDPTFFDFGILSAINVGGLWTFRMRGRHALFVLPPAPTGPELGR